MSGIYFVDLTDRSAATGGRAFAFFPYDEIRDVLERPDQADIWVGLSTRQDGIEIAPIDDERWDSTLGRKIRRDLMLDLSTHDTDHDITWSRVWDSKGEDAPFHYVRSLGRPTRTEKDLPDDEPATPKKRTK